MAKDKILVSQIITGQMLIKMTIRNQIPFNRTAIITVCQQYMEESQEMTEFSFMFPANRRW